MIDYDAIKAALNMVTKDLANRLAKENILVNAVCPGPIRGPLWEGPGASGDQLERCWACRVRRRSSGLQSRTSLGHLGDPEDIANMVAFLASDKAKNITGQSINVDGGMVKCII